MFDITELHPKILVFNSFLKNPQDIIDFYNKNKIWNQWYTFGEQTDASSINGSFKNFPKKKEWEDIIKNQFSLITISEDALKFQKQIIDAFYETTNFYFTKNNTFLEEINFPSFSIAKYYSNSGVEEGIGAENMSMVYHTDFSQKRKHIPEYHFHTTCLFYLNDDYKGGEICFKILNNDQTKIEHSIDYKPKSGDIVIFPSTPPFYHGVKKAIDGEKYIIRTYWRKIKNPDQEWEKNKNKYGEENWKEMQERESNNIELKFFINQNNTEYFFQGNRE